MTHPWGYVHCLIGSQSDIRSLPVLYTVYKTVTLLVCLTKKEILDATKLLANKKTQDHTGVSSHFVKQTISTLIDPLFHIFNLSFNTGIVPIQFKIAKVIPIFKAGDRATVVWTIIGLYLFSVPFQKSWKSWWQPDY